jgi:hypothetical protein
MLRSLDTCTNAAVAGSTYQDYNCRFKPQYGPFIVNFTEQNALVRNSGGQLPHIVEFPPANTLVTQQQAGAQSYHAYYMQWQGPGADGQRNTGNDDQVNLTLYDVDPTHPGAAIFSTEDAQSDPLTEKKANQLLAAIGFDKDKFPLPTPFGGYGNFEQFGRMFLSPNQFRQCIPAFTVFNGEYSHVTCPLGSTSVDFGYVHNLQKVKNRYRGGQQYTWTDGAGNSGSANVRTYSGQTHLYWYQDPESTGTFGVLTTRAHPGASTELLKFFESLQSHPTVQ